MQCISSAMEYITPIIENATPFQCVATGGLVGAAAAAIINIVVSHILFGRDIISATISDLVSGRIWQPRCGCQSLGRIMQAIEFVLIILIGDIVGEMAGFAIKAAF